MRGRRQGWLQLHAALRLRGSATGRLASHSLALVWSAAAGPTSAAADLAGLGWSGAHRAAVPVVDGVKSAIWMSRQSIAGMQAANAPRCAVCQLWKRGPAGRIAMMPLVAGGLEGCIASAHRSSWFGRRPWMELDPYLAGAAFLVPSQLVVSGRATPSTPLCIGGSSIEMKKKISETRHISPQQDKEGVVDS